MSGLGWAEAAPELGTTSDWGAAAPWGLGLGLVAGWLQARATCGVTRLPRRHHAPL